MRLTPRDFGQVLTLLRRRATVPTEADKRRATRIDLQTPLAVWLGGLRSKPTILLARDLSPDGLGLFSAAPIAEGREMVISLPRSDENAVLVWAKAAYCSEVADRLFAVGCQLQRPVTSDERQALDAPNDTGEIARIRSSVLT